MKYIKYLSLPSFHYNGNQVIDSRISANNDTVDGLSGFLSIVESLLLKTVWLTSIFDLISYFPSTIPYPFIQGNENDTH